MIDRYKLLYLFLCVVPFFNIITLHFSLVVVLALTALFVLLNLVIFKTQSVQKRYIYYLFISLILLIFLIMSELHSLLAVNISNFQAIRFFGLFIPISIFLIFMYEPKIIISRYLARILVVYIFIFSFSISIDFFILHSALDISLQPMYREEDLSYMSRPFGITGQPSVNSVLLVFFYAFWLSLENKNVQYKFRLLFLVTLGVFLQGSGSGFIAYAMLLVCMQKNMNIFFKLLLLSCVGGGIVWIITSYDFLDKVSYDYISAISYVFYSQINDWLDLVDKSFYSFFMLGGISSNIDFGPLYIISNVGFIYFISFILLFIYLIIISHNHFERMSIYILLVGNLHYPVIFYMTMVFILPIFIFKVIANTNSEKEIYQSAARSL